MTLYQAGQVIPDKRCPKCPGQLDVVREESVVTSGDTVSTHRHYLVKCENCGSQFLYNTSSGTLAPQAS